MVSGNLQLLYISACFTLVYVCSPSEPALLELWAGERSHRQLTILRGSYVTYSTFFLVHEQSFTAGN